MEKDGSRIMNQKQCLINLLPPSPESTPKCLQVTQIDDFVQETTKEEEVKSHDIMDEWRQCGRNFKIFLLLVLWLISSYSLMVNNVSVEDRHQISIPKHETKSYIIPKPGKKVKLSLEGALLPSYYGNLSSHWMQVWVQQNLNSKSINVSDIWTVPLVTESLIGVVPEVNHDRIFHLSKTNNNSALYINFVTNLETNLPVLVSYSLEPIETEDGILYAVLILVILYILIIFDVVHRTLAAMLASTMSVALLAKLNARPTIAEIFSWMDTETLLLLFSMMTLVSIFSETGVFDYMSVVAYKFTGGKVWPLINSLCIITTLMSCFLDNVTTALLLTPVTIKLCQVMKLNPVPILMFTIIFDNIGGAITPIGDPPNVIIASNSEVQRAGINFGSFTLHMGIGTILALASVYIQLRLMYSNTKSFKYAEPEIQIDLKREIAVWERTAAYLSSYSKEEDTVKESLIKKTVKLQDKLKNTTNNTITSENYKTNLKDLEKQYPIKNKPLLIKSGVTLLLVICVFFLHSVPELSRLGLGWTALLGALLLLLLYDTNHLEIIFARVEWATLMFFASLFILMEALSKLGLIDWIGKQTQIIIMSVGPEARLAVAIILILWISAVASAFVDNLPLTTMMVRIATNLANNPELNLPLPPLIWALSFGACLGGNGSLFGSSSNIVCAGVAEQHGYRFTFMEFMKVGLPVMFFSLSIVTIYLIVCHVVLGWH